MRMHERGIRSPGGRVVANVLGVFVLMSLGACGDQPLGNEAKKPDWVKLGIPDGQWPTYGGGPYNQNYSPLTQIDKSNVANLEVAWVYNYGAGEHDLGDLGLDYRFEVTPLLIGGVMYISTPTSPNAPGRPDGRERVVDDDARSGERHPLRDDRRHQRARPRRVRARAVCEQPARDRRRYGQAALVSKDRLQGSVGLGFPDAASALRPRA